MSSLDGDLARDETPAGSLAARLALALAERRAERSTSVPPVPLRRSAPMSGPGDVPSESGDLATLRARPGFMGSLQQMAPVGGAADGAGVSVAPDLAGASVIDLTGFGVMPVLATVMPATDESAEDAQRFQVGSASSAEADGLAAARAELERAQASLAAAQEELAILRQRHARACAERDAAATRAEDAALLLLLPLADDLDRALAHQPPALAADHAAWVAGIALIASRLHALLAQHDVCLIPALGQPFDPHVHDAVAQLSRPQSDADAAVAPHTVSAVYRAGYTRQQRVLRPAQVQVALPAPDAASVADAVVSQERAS